MALYVAIADRLDELFAAAFSRSGETGAAMAPVHDLFVLKASTGDAPSEDWVGPIDDLLSAIEAKGFDLTEGAEPTLKTHYMRLFATFATQVRLGSPVNGLVLGAMSGVIAERGGPGASHRNAYLQYLVDNVNTFYNAAP